MPPAPVPPVDPARDAAAVLRRIGFALLVVATPALLFVSPSAALGFSAVAVALIAGAATFDGAARPLGDTLRRARSSHALAALALLLGWCALSLLWTPARRTGAFELARMGAVLGSAALAAVALPDRMRSANLYLVPIGVAISAGVAILVPLLRGGDAAAGLDPSGPGVAGLVVLAWAGIAWLRSRGRDIGALALAAAVAVAAAFSPDPLPGIAFACGALAFLVAQAATRGAAAIGLAVALLLAAAPLLLALLPSGPLAVAPGWAADLAPWRADLLAEPSRWLTGHGLGARWVAAQAGPAAFGIPALAVWFDLGLVGALAAAAALAAILRGPTPDGPLRPGEAAALATAFVLTLSGPQGGGLWWPCVLASVLVVFVAAERGQFRTRRPRATAAAGPARGRA